MHFSHEAVPVTIPKPASHVAHVAAPFAGQAAPAAALPLLHVQCLVPHWRFCVLLGVTVSCSAAVQVVHATQALLLR